MLLDDCRSFFDETHGLPSSFPRQNSTPLGTWDVVASLLFLSLDRKTVEMALYDLETVQNDLEGHEKSCSDVHEEEREAGDMASACTTRIFPQGINRFLDPKAVGLGRNGGGRTNVRLSDGEVSPAGRKGPEVDPRLKYHCPRIASQ